MQAIHPEIPFFTRQCKQHEGAALCFEIKLILPIQAFCFSLFSDLLQAQHLLEINAFCVLAIGVFLYLDETLILLYHEVALVVQTGLEDLLRCGSLVKPTTD